jgi:hypothetical protein
MTVRARSRAYRATLRAILLVQVLALAACSPTVQGSASPAAGATTPSARSGGCTVTANGTGRINISGGASSVVIKNNVTSLSCGAGAVELTRITDGAVTLSAAGSPVDVAVGATGTVGRYQVSVLSIQGGTARFQMVPA